MQDFEQTNDHGNPSSSLGLLMLSHTLDMSLLEPPPTLVAFLFLRSFTSRSKKDAGKKYLLLFQFALFLIHWKPGSFRNSHPSSTILPNTLLPLVLGILVLPVFISDPTGKFGFAQLNVPDRLET